MGAVPVYDEAAGNVAVAFGALCLQVDSQELYMPLRVSVSVCEDPIHIMNAAVWSLGGRRLCTCSPLRKLYACSTWLSLSYPHQVFPGPNRAIRHLQRLLAVHGGPDQLGREMSMRVRKKGKTVLNIFKAACV